MPLLRATNDDAASTAIGTAAVAPSHHGAVGLLSEQVDVQGVHPEATPAGATATTHAAVAATAAAAAGGDG
ncbi:MAG TPA: hypothetical protein VF734_05390 [Pseudonocardiaceae bacterium]|jgi:hypothetical protein